MGLKLLAVGPSAFDREDIADLMIAYAPSELSSQKVYGRRGIAERGHRQAIARLRGCIALAKVLGDRTTEQTASLALARALIKSAERKRHCRT